MVLRTVIFLEIVYLHNYFHPLFPLPRHVVYNSVFYLTLASLLLNRLV